MLCEESEMLHFPSPPGSACSGCPFLAILSLWFSWALLLPLAFSHCLGLIIKKNAGAQHVPMSWDPNGNSLCTATLWGFDFLQSPENESPSPHMAQGERV